MAPLNELVGCVWGRAEEENTGCPALGILDGEVACVGVHVEDHV